MATLGTVLKWSQLGVALVCLLMALPQWMPCVKSSAEALALTSGTTGKSVSSLNTRIQSVAFLLCQQNPQQSLGNFLFIPEGLR